MKETIQCYCGDCKLEISGEPNMTLCCHCGEIDATTHEQTRVPRCPLHDATVVCVAFFAGDCRRWGGGLFQAAKLYLASQVKLTAGEVFSKYDRGVPKPENCTNDRKSCVKCGGAVYSQMAPYTYWIMVPGGLFDTPFDPTCHICYKSKVMSIKDGKPKFAGYPAAMGGTDDILAD